MGGILEQVKPAASGHNAYAIIRLMESDYMTSPSRPSFKVADPARSNLIGVRL